MPGLSAIVRLEDAEPCVTGLAIGKAGQIDGAVIVRAGEQVRRITRGHGERRLILALEERVAIGPLRARDHVHVAAGDLSSRRQRRQEKQEEAKT
jgi:hypothetical protein